MQTPPRLPGMAPGVSFPGISLPSTDFQAVRDGRRGQLFYIDVDLSTARSNAAGTQANLSIAGNFLYVDQRLNTGVATLHFQDQNANAVPVTMFPGALWKVGFTQLGIENSAQAGASMRLIFGVDVDALPISAAGVTVLNPVAVVDGGKARTLAGGAFIGTTALGASVGNYSKVQLYNPSATKKAVIEQVGFSGPVAGWFVAAVQSAPLANDVGGAPSKLIGGTVSSCHVYWEQTAGFPAGAALLSDYLPANGSRSYLLSEPIVLQPSTGIVLFPGFVNTAFAAWMEFYEESYP